MNLAELGYFSRTHGTKGQLVLKTSLEFDAGAMQAVFIEQNGSKAPYFILETKQAGGELILSLEGVDSPEKAKALLNRTLFAEEKYLVQQAGEQDWLGFELVDQNRGSLGKIDGISHNGQQSLLHLNLEGKEVILPMVDEFVKRIDHDLKTIYYEAPEGLIELYLEGD
ncbi:MAG TPA: ribosome maturation factor RimM [Bacteroidia bacterium]|nr:ribosome maturation factor RimM [Bacteroidia bacterium]